MMAIMCVALWPAFASGDTDNSSDDASQHRTDPDSIWQGLSPTQKMDVLKRAAESSENARNAGSVIGAKAQGGIGFGEQLGQNTPVVEENEPAGGWQPIRFAENPTPVDHGVPPSPGPGKDHTRKSKISTPLLLGGAGAIGALQGFFSGGAWGAVGGAGIAVAAAWFYSKEDYGAAVGIAVGGIIGAALFPPFGGLVGAVVAGAIGHFIGKLFSK